MNASASSNIGFMSGFSSGVTPERVLFPVQPNTRPPPFVVAVPVHALESTFVVAVNTLVAQVLHARSNAQVGSPVVQAIAVDVIYIHAVRRRYQNSVQDDGARLPACTHATSRINRSSADHCMPIPILNKRDVISINQRCVAFGQRHISNISNNLNSSFFHIGNERWLVRIKKPRCGAEEDTKAGALMTGVNWCAHFAKARSNALLIASHVRRCASRLARARSFSICLVAMAYGSFALMRRTRALITSPPSR